MPNPSRRSIQPKPEKKPRRKDKLSKKAKLEIITQVLIEKPGAHLKRGFQKALRKMFSEQPYSINVSASYMSELLKEVLNNLERSERYLHSKRWYMLQHQRVYEEEVEARDRSGQKATLRDMTKLDGHLKDIHVFEKGDTETGKQIEEFFDDKGTSEKGK